MNFIKTTTITKIAMFTDIHWGAKGNSVVHNQDNLDFIDWFIAQCEIEKPSHIAFLGDWFENRNAINVLTNKYSYDGIKKLNELGIPIFFIVGNHDLYYRQNRSAHSTYGFEALSNVIMINEPTSVNEEYLFTPYIFEADYADLLPEMNKHRFVFGHFEFKSFIMTGHTVMEHGLDSALFTKPTYIFSGHFHKRQANNNVIYIGNTFPTSYGDAGDSERGMCVLDTRNDDVYFIDWDDSPKYLKTSLTQILEGGFEPPPKCRVKCLLDVDLTYSEVQGLKEQMLRDYGLREFSLQENIEEKKQAISEGGEDTDIDDLQLSSIDDMVQVLLATMSNTTNIQTSKLMDIYRNL